VTLSPPTTLNFLARIRTIAVSGRSGKATRTSAALA
jgi:hypothetical protein